jgi:hypothetical protein
MLPREIEQALDLMLAKKDADLERLAMERRKNPVHRDKRLDQIHRAESWLEGQRREQYLHQQQRKTGILNDR